MFSMFNQIFSAIAVLFGAVENGAHALSAVSDIAKEKAEAYRDEERIKIKARLALLDKQQQLAIEG